MFEGIEFTNLSASIDDSLGFTFQIDEQLSNFGLTSLVTPFEASLELVDSFNFDDFRTTQPVPDVASVEATASSRTGGTLDFDSFRATNTSNLSTDDISDLITSSIFAEDNITQFTLMFDTDFFL